jgi:hypothetical protein
VQPAFVRVAENLLIRQNSLLTGQQNADRVCTTGRMGRPKGDFDMTTIVTIVGLTALLVLFSLAVLGGVCMAIGERCGICQGGQQ